ncbi:hypothetical protein FJZ21_01405 [Candidatus Pacearchaeota archaeon]|nr:hypothetical protein [Candidatus Pacearchaeota archaeon]
MNEHKLDKARKNAIKGILENALARLPPEVVVTFRRQPGDFIQACGMEMRDDGYESVRYINDKDVRSEALVLLCLRDNLPSDTRVQLSKGLEVPAIQLDQVVRSVLKVGAYKGPLPFYAEVFYRHNPTLNN